jgi:hypothetical protein
VTLPEKIEEVLRLEAEATPGEWMPRNIQTHLGPSVARSHAAWCLDVGGRRTIYGLCGNDASDLEFIAAARNIIRPLAQAYTAALTALEASDSDRKKLKARVAELEAELAKATKPKSGIEFVRKLFFEHGD